MRKIVISTLIMISALLSTTATSYAETNKSQDATLHDYIVELKAAPAKPNALTASSRQIQTDSQMTIASKHRAKVTRNYYSAINGFSAQMTVSEAAALANDPSVKLVERDEQARLAAIQKTTNWGLDRIDQRDLPGDNKYHYSTTDQRVNAYVIDSGIRTSHTDFGGRADVSADFVGDGYNGQDCYGHGTDVASAIGGSQMGVAKQTNLHSVRIFNCGGQSTSSQIIAAVDWVTANGVKPAVVNMSVETGPDPAVDSAVENSINSGFVYVIAAGNDALEANLFSPARVPEALTVGATDRYDVQANFSNYGSAIDLWAPGVIVAADSNESDSSTASVSGTSISTPLVAGAAVLYLQKYPQATVDQVETALKNSATTGVLQLADQTSPNKLLYAPLLSSDNRTQLSLNADRSSAAPLAGQPLKGSAYFFQGSARNVASVSFSIDGVPYSMRTSVPFDLNGTKPDGTAIPFDASTLAAGTHTVGATTTLKSGKIVKASDSFLVVRVNINDILVSEHEDRSDAKPLVDSGAISNLSYIFVAPSPLIKSVQYNIYGYPYSKSTKSPFDMNGTKKNGMAKPFDPTSLHNGANDLQLIISLTDGSQLSYKLSLVIDSMQPIVLYSASADLSNAVTMDYQNIDGVIYPFIKAQFGTSRVDVALDNCTTLCFTANSSTTVYNLAGSKRDGTPKGLNTKKLIPGLHRFDVTIHYGDGFNGFVSGWFQTQ